MEQAIIISAQERITVVVEGLNDNDITVTFSTVFLIPPAALNALINRGFGAILFIFHHADTFH